MANSSTKKGAKKKAAAKKTVIKSPKKAEPPGKPQFVNLKNGTLEVRLDNNQKIVCATSIIEPELYRYFMDGARVENDKIIIPVQSFEVSLTVARLQSLLEPRTNHTKDSLPGRILKVWDNFGEFLTKHLERQKLSQTDLGLKTGIPSHNISFYCRGNGNPSLENFFRILKALNISLDQL